MGAAFSVLPSFLGPLYPSKISDMGIDGNPPALWPLDPFPASLMIACPMPLLGRDILTILVATLQLTLSPSASLLLPLLAPSLYRDTDPPLPCIPSWGPVVPDHSSLAQSLPSSVIAYLSLCCECLFSFSPPQLSPPLN
uniref:Uncharacterized protein n=1 Tax=Myotis myotis TaxID=51298 RepID=A0A7J7XHS1_MYOMY|nr:hypothetical protein mMyoMyo1_011636 [Myotis myotis]